MVQWFPALIQGQLSNPQSLQSDMPR